MARTTTSRQFCEQVGISQPIILAPMAGGPNTPALIAEVANAGGLASIAAGYLSPGELTNVLDEARRLTPGSLAINIFMPPDGELDTRLAEPVREALERIAIDIGAPSPAASPPDPDVFAQQVDIAAASDASLISFTFGLPPAAVVARLQASGKLVAGTVNTIEEAQKVAAVGCDAVILQGFEAGAHRGGLAPRGDAHVGLMSLLEQARVRLDTYVIASGGIASGAGVAACLALDAAAIQIGTAFLVADESGATDEWKKAVLSSSDADTTISAAITGKGARGIRNDLLDRMQEAGDDLPAYPILNSYTAGIRRRARELGEPGYQSLWAGQSGGVAEAGSARAIYERIVTELNDTVERLEG